MFEKIRKLETDPMPNSFCIYPWMHIQVKPNGQAKPCCRFNHMRNEYMVENQGYSTLKPYNVNNMSLSDIHKSKFWNELRSDMLEGKTIPGCHKCDNDDISDNWSMRANANNEWNERKQASPIPSNRNIKFKYLELTTGRYCNLKCRTCASDLSTTWESDDKAIKGLYKDSVSNSPRQEYSHLPKILDLTFSSNDFKEILLVKLTGGEPMITPTFIPFIDTIINSGYAKNIILEIYTNTSWVPKDKILNRLKQFKFVKVFLSIDGIGEVNDYIRAPSKWDTVNESAETWIKFSKENQSFSIVFSPTINLYNILNLSDMIEWWYDLQIKYFSKNFVLYASEGEKKVELDTGFIFNVVTAKFSPTMLQTPTYLSASLLPDKTEVIEKLKKIKFKKIEWASSEDEIKYSKRVESIIDHIIYNLQLEPLDNLETFINFSYDLDKLRNQNLQKSLPELWDQIKDKVEYKGNL